MRFTFLLTFFVAIALCSAAQEKDEIVAAPQPDEPAAPAFEPLANGTEVNPIAGKDIAGNVLPLLNFADSKVYLIDFWFMRCPPCVASIPKLIEFQNTYSKRGFTVVGVNSFDLLIDDKNNPYNLLSQPRSKVQELIDQHHINYPLYFSSITLDQSYLVKAYPTLYLVKNGVVISSHLGFDEAGMDELEQAIQNALSPEH